MNKYLKYSVGLTIGLAALAGWMARSAPAATEGDSSAVKAFVGARIIDGTGKPAMQNATLVIRNGRIAEVGPSVKIPAGTQRIDAAGKTIMPGMINAHGHVGDAGQLGLYARYGVTTVFSLSGDDELEIRDQVRAQQWAPGLSHARLFIAGPAVASKTPEEARKAVDDLAKAKVDIVKFRLEDQLGTSQKMPPAVYAAIFDEARKKGLRVAVHVVYLSDAKAVLKLGADYIAHSVRDFEIDDETVALLKKNNAFYCPTLTREVAMFTYAEKPAFLKDAFFLKGADREQLAKVQEASFQQTMRTDSAANWYKDHLPLAIRNLKKLEDAGVPVVMGTDSGAVYRFQGFFEHLELEYMVKAGLTPMQILVSSTSTPARLLKAGDQIGTLEPGRWADLMVLNANPLDDIRNTQKIDSVWIAGNRVPGK